ncbi:galactokinase [Williamsia sp. SKLECPSW1]
MTVVASAPGRVNLLGEHTDYNHGFALPIALTERTEVRWSPDESRHLLIDADGYGRLSIPVGVAPGEVDGWAAYVAGVAWSLGVEGRPVTGGRLHVTSDVPVGAGLSSSAALQCSLIGAFTAVTGTPDRLSWARIAQRAENDFVGAPTGLLDQLASLHGEVDRALLIDFDSLTVEPVPFDPTTADVTLVVIDSHITHGHAGGEYAARRASCERAAADLGLPNLRSATPGHPDDVLAAVRDDVDRRRARHVLTENTRVLRVCESLRDGDLAAVGEMMDASHASMRDDFEITTPGIDLIAATARSAGALGARMTGGGFGGCVIALVETARVDTLVASVVAAAEHAGGPTPTAFTARAGRGASVDQVR